MIFVTVGAQMPFDRLIQGVDRWAGLRRRNDVFAQIGPSNYIARHIRTTRFLTPQEFRGAVEEARLIVAHAGMGSIITALELGKPIVVMPRRGDLHETRNDHQVATAKKFSSEGRLVVAYEEVDLLEVLDRCDDLCGTMHRIRTSASDELIAAIRAFLKADVRRSGVTPDPFSQ